MSDSDVDAINTTIDRAGHTVLVVDDNPATRYATVRVLRAAGFQADEAATGAQGLERSADGVSAVVLDVHLPDMDGFEVCRRIRERPGTELLPVVHLSAAYVRDRDRIHGLNSGADAYLVHPVEPALLIGTVQALIRARTAEVQLRQSEHRFRAIYQHAQSGIATIDGDGRFREANPAMLRMLGRPADEVSGRSVIDFAPGGPGSEAARQLPALLAAGEEGWRGEFPLLHADGRLVYVDWSVSGPIEPGRRIAVAIDASERHDLEQRRREVLEREQAARASAERHNRTKDDFIAVLSHELRTPLNAILGWVHILKRRLPELPESSRGLAAIERNVITQARIISDILDVSRINSGKLHLEREEIDPAETVAESLASLRPGIDEKQLRVQTDIDAAHEPAWLDPTRFQQIFFNLLTNAIKFSDTGGVIQVLLRRCGDVLELEVRDHGRGIEPEFLPHLFDRFTQSDSPGSRRHGGLGLGLSIVKHLAELHGGSVSAASPGVGQGAAMTVRLPVNQAGPAAPDAAPEDPEEHEALDLDGLDVLVVEDDRETAEMLQLVLSERRANVRVERDYEGAVQALSQRWPQVMVSDIGLPGRDGYDLLARVRLMERDRSRPLPVIALTAFGRPQDRERMLASGFDLHLGKPLTPHLLLQAIVAVT
ncbi:response regulator [Ramlibacter sp. AW1]|uniref:histidine kinase n=1 Tax=Ramlibacter aurantiacus TaxID=2801330 RepID=A0A936ZTX2_9BURK|nr:response regulator [Ramlibacter aurantiacus]MBL0420539.1 response regulator [Ramlibacter aurantiacus]